MIKYRHHRGGLVESMETCQEFSTMDEVREHVAKFLYPFCVDVTPENFHSEFYCKEDKRIGWAPVCIVTVDGFGVVGWADQESE
jgi:hypothetical protein